MAATPQTTALRKLVYFPARAQLFQDKLIEIRDMAGTAAGVKTKLDLANAQLEAAQVLFAEAIGLQSMAD